MTLKVHLENGSITQEGGKWVARNLLDSYVTYGNDIVHCQMAVVDFMKEKYLKTPHQVDFKKTLTGFNYSVYKWGKK